MHEDKFDYDIALHLQGPVVCRFSFLNFGANWTAACSKRSTR